MPRVSSPPSLLVAALLLAACAESRYVVNGERLLAAGDYTAARDELEKALAEDPDSHAALLGLGRLHLDLGQPATARPLVERAHALEETPATRMLLALVRSADGRHDEAATLLGRVAEDAPQDARPNFLLGAVWRRAGQPEQAVAALRVAVAQAPELYEAHLALAELLRELSRHDEAEKALRAAVARAAAAPTDPTKLAALHFSLAVTFEATKRYADAKRSFLQAERFAPQMIEATIGRGRAERLLGELDEAARTLKEAARKAPKSGRARLELGRVYLDYHLDAQALAAFREAVQLEPSDREAYPPLLLALSRGGEDTGDGLDLLAKAAAALADDLDVQLRYGRAALATRRFEAAIAAFSRAIAIKRNSVEAFSGLVLAEAGAGKHEAATHDLELLSLIDAAKAEEVKAQLESAAKPAAASEREAAAPDPDRKAKKGKKAKRRR